MTLRKQCLVLFAVAFVVRLALVLATHQYRDLSRYELQRTAYSLASSGVFGNPYLIPTGPTAHVSPGYPLILAGIYRVFGAGMRGEIAKEVLASAVSSLVWALVPFASAVLEFPAVVGLGAGLAGALLPVKLSVETKGDWESPYSALAVMLILCVTAYTRRTASFSVRAAIVSGLAWGVSSLFVSALLPVFVATLFFWRSWRFIVWQIAAVAIVLSPWVIRNDLALGSPVATRTNTGLELRLSNNDLAGPIERKNFERGVYHVYHPLQSLHAAEQVRDLGEVAFDRMATKEALDWIRRHPGRFVSLTAQRVVCFWFQPVPGQGLKAIWLGLVAGIGFAGLWLLYRSQKQTAWVIAVVLLVFPLPNYLVHVGLRHRYPLDWLCMLLASYAVWVAMGRGRLNFPRTRA